MFVTGFSAGTGSAEDYGTVAYNAVTGARLWAKRYNGPSNGADLAVSMAVAPGGGAVFVTGYSGGTTTGADYATIAYDAATGAQLWARRYNGPGNGRDEARSVVAGAGGARVFVTGQSTGATSGDDYATVAYNAATGAQLWIRRYDGPGNKFDGATALAVDRRGRTVVVTGKSRGAGSGFDYATIAYRTSTGTQLWARRYNGTGDHGDGASSITAAADGSKVFVTGTSWGTGSGDDYATVAYGTATGTRLWVSRYHGPVDLSVAHSVAVSPTGKTVFVTGDSFGVTSGWDYATVAYRG